MKWGILGLSILLVAVLLAAGFASAATLTFEQSETSGDAINGDIDIVKIGAYVQGDYQYFYVETRDSGLNQPSVGDTYELMIDVEANDNGNDETEYLVVFLNWTNNNGNIGATYWYSVKSSSFNTLTSNDVTISGSRVTVRVPAISLQDVDVLNVEYTTMQISSTSGYLGSDDAIYYTNSGGNSGGNNGGSGGTGTTSPDLTGYWWLGGVAAFVCWAVIIIIWIFVSLWAYKNAKKKCNEHPGLWFVIVFFLGIIGLIIYIVVVKDECQKQQMAQGEYYQAPPPPPQ